MSGALGSKINIMCTGQNFYKIKGAKMILTPKNKTCIRGVLKKSGYVTVRLTQKCIFNAFNASAVLLFDRFVTEHQRQ